LRDKQQSIYMMGIKQKDENSAGGLHNALAAGTTVKGNIITETDFRLDGQVEGDINCSGKIVIGPKGRVIGNIISVNAEVLGEVEGSVRVSEKLVLKATANIKGDIFTQSLEIEPNARFNGVCNMCSETKK
jgi:cytoskeletal protein CcmA (bactofilin family)